MRGGIAMLTSLFPPSVGGIQAQTLALARALTALGEDVHVVTRPARGRPAREQIDGVAVHRTGLLGPGPAATVAYVAGAARLVASLGAGIRLVHAHQMLSPASAAIALHVGRGLPFAVTVHASGEVGEVAHLARQGPLGTARLLALRATCAAFVAVSAPIEAELASAGIPRGRIHRIANGVDTRRFAPAPAAERERLRAVLGLAAPGPLAVYSGRLAPEKGVDVLLEAWALLSRSRLAPTLCVVGDGPEREPLLARARSLGIARAVRFPGAVEDPSAWLRAADVFVLPSRAEGLSVALLEAMACGLAVVATDVGGTREVAPEGTALLVPAEDPQALAAALRRSLRGGEEAAGRGAAARARVAREYGIAQVARRHLDLYEEVADAAGEGGGRGRERSRSRAARRDRVPDVVVSGGD